MIFTAPGKAVLWGEYAVLAGAPAAIMAVSATAQVSIETHSDHTWHFSSAGFDSPSVSVNKEGETLPTGPTTGFTTAILQHWGITQLSDLCDGMHLHTDSSDFFSAGQKLGLGSSAAVCNATYAGLCQLLGKVPSLAEAQLIHRTWQNGTGSGLDVASSWFGGVISYQNGVAQPLQWPEDLHWQLVWTGKSAKTAEHISRFDAWRQTDESGLLDDLSALSRLLCEQPINDELLTHYQKALFALDQSAKLNIFTTEHLSLVKLAASSGLTYKPCGAGGGDIGIALSQDKDALEKFRSKVSDQNFLLLDLEMAEHGITVKD